MDLVESHISNLSLRTKVNGASDYSIHPIIGDVSDTLFYIINYGQRQGWQILSADARVPAILAEGKSGMFSLEEGSPAMRVWLDCLKRDMYLVRNSRDEDLKFSPEEISHNKAFWFGDSPRQQFPPEEEPEGSWVVSTQSEIITVKEVDHMVPKWDQVGPYNRCCPLKTNSDYQRAPTGCVAVAGSQLLWFLHDTLGVPSAIPYDCVISGNCQYFSRAFSPPSTDAWDYISFEYNSSSAYQESVLLSYVGYLADMHYRNGYSWALPANLRTGVFNHYGINCSHGGYNENIVKTSLEGGMPVIVTATSLLIPADFDIHSFVIDGYKKTYIKYTHHHFWQPYDPDIIPDPDLFPDYYTYSYTSPEITAIKINWGWWTQWHPNYLWDDDWYSLTGDWATTELDSTITSYNYNRQMIYNFSIEQ
ncbi:MAG: C10 family peptidase [Bacteroidales bacterium]|nr:C10 family peptidase [Bacteroidales bacterium]